jgi:hypothetical protein
MGLLSFLTFGLIGGKKSQGNKVLDQLLEQLMDLSKEAARENIKIIELIEGAKKERNIEKKMQKYMQIKGEMATQYRVEQAVLVLENRLQEVLGPMMQAMHSQMGISGQMQQMQMQQMQRSGFPNQYPQQYPPMQPDQSINYNQQKRA